MPAWRDLLGIHIKLGVDVPTFRQIEAFQAVMATGSVTKAAETLGLGQPAVSRLIADLETSIQFPLFLRAARTLMPTSKARELLREVERSFLGMDHIRSAAQRLAASDRGAVRLAVVPSLITEVMQELIRPFAKANPDVAISVEVLATLEATEFLESVRCDLGITNEYIQAPSLHAQVLSHKVAVCALSRRHRLAKLDRPLLPKDLADQRFVSFIPNSHFRRRVDKVFADAKVERDLRYEARTTAAAWEMAVALDAVAILPVAPRVGSSSDLRLLPFRPQLASDVVMLWHRHRALSPTAEIFANFARERIGKRGGKLSPRGPVVTYDRAEHDGSPPAERRRSSNVEATR